jgi:hypothetical protein
MKITNKILLPPTQFVYNKIITASERRGTRLSKYPEIMKKKEI